ncbi:hypothetical protein M5689_017500 [Euphorbia peplus]|nr:hypothetical protein M5689_017500 [Euphorbia peplus]
MDLIQLHKIHAMNKSKKNQLLDNFFLYTIILIACSVLCSSPFWFPSLISSIKLLIFVYLPKIISFLLSPKLVFIVGNLIIILLLGKSKFFVSNSLPPISDVYYNEFINRTRGHQMEKKEGKAEQAIREDGMKSCEVKMEVKVWDEGNVVELVKERDDLHGEDEINLPTEELNKRADDFIARVNRQRRHEAGMLQ